MNDKFFILMPCCLLVSGFYRSAIYDMQRETLDFVPTDLHDFCQECNRKSLQYIASKYDKNDKIIVDEYIDFLIENEYAILGSKHDTKHISSLVFNQTNYGHITNCVCEYSIFFAENAEKNC
jgi:hypothetical protein